MPTGKGRNLPDEATRRRIEALKGPVELETYVSLTCTNCPDVVQALNVLAILNPQIRHTAIDGALFPEEAERLRIQAVPSVFCNGEPLHTGRSSLGRTARADRGAYREPPRRGRNNRTAATTS